MSKRGYIYRYHLIIKMLKSKPYSTYEEIERYIQNQLEYLQIQDDNLNTAFSKRTWLRDKKEISYIFGVEIEYSKVDSGYFISESQAESVSFQRMMESFDLLNAVNLAEDLAPFVCLEKRKPQGTENIFGLLHAIRNRLQVKFEHHKFWAEGIMHRNVDPYGLKEFKSRWYLVAKDNVDAKIKTFGLDRISNLVFTSKKFVVPASFDLENLYRYSFGIISPEEEQEPEEIILSFTQLQGQYIKSLPLHESQKVLIDTKDELKVKLKLFVTHDFIMELLSYSNDVKVLQPESLADTIKAKHQSSANQYL